MENTKIYSMFQAYVYQLVEHFAKTLLKSSKDVESGVGWLDSTAIYSILETYQAMHW